MSSCSCRVRAVADPHRPRAAVALQVVERLLREFGPAVDAVHELQGAGPLAVGVLPAVLQPVPEAGRLLGEPDAEQAVQRERGVADPGVAVVPVARAADRLGQAAGRCRDDRPRRFEGQELERDGRAVDHLPPAAGVGAPREPAPPVGDGVAEQVLRLADPGAPAGLVLGSQAAQDERGLLPFPEREVGDHAGAVAPQRYGGGQAEAQPRPVEAGAVLVQVAFVSGAGVVEGGTALQMKRQPAADDPDPPDQLVLRRAGAADRHVILDLAHAILVQEAGDEDGGVRPVELLAPEVVAGRGDAEAAALAVVQDGGEDAGGIEVRQAEPVDRAIHPHQRGRAQVADDAVILDGLVARFHRTVLPGWHPVAVPDEWSTESSGFDPTPTLRLPTATNEIRAEEPKTVTSISVHTICLLEAVLILCAALWRSRSPGGGRQRSPASHLRDRHDDPARPRVAAVGTSCGRRRPEPSCWSRIGRPRARSRR